MGKKLENALWCRKNVVPLQLQSTIVLYWKR